MSDHPYRTAEDRAFWSRAVAAGFDATATVDQPPFRLGREDRFMSAGSCFASNVRRYLEGWGYRYTVAEPPHPQWPEATETLYYEAFSARYGNIYTARQMAQLLMRAAGSFSPVEEYWTAPDGSFIDPFRPGLAHRAWSVEEFRILTSQHLDAVRAAVERSTVIVFTLGLTEAWYSVDDGAVFPACPGTVSGEFDPDRHRFTNFTVEEVAQDLEAMVASLRSMNSGLRVVLTVSPVPLVATASGRHALTATTYSKSVLRVAADQVAAHLDGVAYFPAYEIVTGPHNRSSPFEDDLRSVREPVIAGVMDAFAASFLGGDATSSSEKGPWDATDDLDRRVAAAVASECEEMMADDTIRSVPDPGTPEGAPAAERSPGGVLRRLTGRRSR